MQYPISLIIILENAKMLIMLEKSRLIWKPYSKLHVYSIIRVHVVTRIQSGLFGIIKATWALKDQDNLQTWQK